ncbi:MgtC/SapB family protein [Crateriforma conspicua]|uniref:Putative Mg(2+) transport ATPase n=1 Tax=Crateriforma conspicua TaxID=2527996 RepID=A0A5C5YDF4_9PLAN|nr:MgtC/SapB family protein [Crateriforma conspicua]TWT71342.1 putative Mg(2+) transport ATPase [Crateriforma conspicua]
MTWIEMAPIAVAAGLGFLLGLEREIAGKPAGIRTHMIVAAGSAMLMLLSQRIFDDFQSQQPDQLLRSDPIRVLQAIVVGISFLGAGTIVHDQHEGVEGLTTAATIYLTAGIGVAAAIGQTRLAIVVTLGGLVVLGIVGALERCIARWHRRNSQRICESDQNVAPENHPSKDDSHE